MRDSWLPPDQRDAAPAPPPRVVTERAYTLWIPPENLPELTRDQTEDV